MSLVTRAIEVLRRRQDVALGVGIFAMAAIILVTLLWSEEQRSRLAINCEPSPALNADGPTRAFYLVRLASAPSPEDTCAEIKRQLEQQSTPKDGDRAR